MKAKKRVRRPLRPRAVVWRTALTMHGVLFVVLAIVIAAIVWVSSAAGSFPVDTDGPLAGFWAWVAFFAGPILFVIGLNGFLWHWLVGMLDRERTRSKRIGIVVLAVLIDLPVSVAAVVAMTLIWLGAIALR